MRMVRLHLNTERLPVGAFVLIFAAGVTVAGCGEGAPARIALGPSPIGMAGETVFADDFESASLLSTWQDGVDPARHRVVDDAASAHAGARYLTVTYPAGRDGGWLTRFLPGGDSLYVSYYVRFPGSWRGGTKLVAFYGSRNDDKWSAFGKAGVCPSGNDFFAAMVATEPTGDPGPLRFYTYYASMPRPADGVCFGRLGDGSETYVPPLTMTPDVWHRIEFFVRINTPGQKDGRQVFWVDGIQRGTWSGLSFRETEALQLNAVQLTFSASGGVPDAQELHVDDVVVRTARP
jgi:hypothetical protein